MRLSLGEYWRGPGEDPVLEAAKIGASGCLRSMGGVKCCSQNVAHG